MRGRPFGIEFLSPEQVYEQCEKLPPEFQDTHEWVQKHRELFKMMRCRNISTHEKFATHTEIIAHIMSLKNMESESKNNYIFDTKKGTVVRCSGLSSTLGSMASSAGIDSGPTRNMVELIQLPNGHRIGRYKPEVLQAATIQHAHVPVFQHTSCVAYYLLMKKRLHGKIQPQPTYPVQFGEGTEFHDGNYVVAQPKLEAGEHVHVSSIPQRFFSEYINKELLPDLADAVESGAWNLNGENLWMNTAYRNFVITDLEKPGNEGWGPNQKWGTAVLSSKGDGTSNHPWKWRHNVRVGYDAVQSGLLEHSIHKQELVQEWNAMKEARVPKD